MYHRVWHHGIHIPHVIWYHFWMMHYWHCQSANLSIWNCFLSASDLDQGIFAPKYTCSNTVAMGAAQLCKLQDACWHSKITSTVLSGASAYGCLIAAQAWKIWGWALTWRRCLNNSTMPVQAPILDLKFTDRQYWIDSHCSFTRASI